MHDGGEAITVTIRVRDARSTHAPTHPASSPPPPGAAPPTGALETSPSGLCRLHVARRGTFQFAFDRCIRRRAEEPDAAAAVAAGTPGRAVGGRPQTEAESQAELFEHVGRPLVEHAAAGFDSCVVAYGATGAGKTHSVFGPPRSLGTELEGLVPRVCRDIFRRCEAAQAQWEAAQLAAADGGGLAAGLAGAGGGDGGWAGEPCWSVHAAYLEVYLEDVFDLLADRRKLAVRTAPMSTACNSSNAVPMGSSAASSDAGGGPPSRPSTPPPEEAGTPAASGGAAPAQHGFEAHGLRWEPVGSYEDVAVLLRHGEALRTVAATNIHERSSRSHTLFFLEIRQRQLAAAAAAGRDRVDCLGAPAAPTECLAGCGEAGGVVELRSRVALCDLAGCERIREAGTETGLALEQACSINLSLLALGSVVEAAVQRGRRVAALRRQIDALPPRQQRPPSDSDATEGPPAAAAAAALRAQLRQVQALGSLPEFRQATLTKLLKPFLCGRSRAAVLVAVSPDAADAANTLQALRFADRAKQLPLTHARRNLGGGADGGADAAGGKTVAVSSLSQGLRSTDPAVVARCRALRSGCAALADARRREGELAAELELVGEAAHQRRATAEAAAAAVEEQRRCAAAPVGAVATPRLRAMAAERLGLAERQAAAALASADAAVSREEEVHRLLADAAAEAEAAGEAWRQLRGGAAPAGEKRLEAHVARLSEALRAANRRAARDAQESSRRMAETEIAAELVATETAARHAVALQQTQSRAAAECAYRDAEVAAASEREAAAAGALQEELDEQRRSSAVVRAEASSALAEANAALEALAEARRAAEAEAARNAADLAAAVAQIRRMRRALDEERTARAAEQQARDAREAENRRRLADREAALRDGADALEDARRRATVAVAAVDALHRAVDDASARVVGRVRASSSDSGGGSVATAAASPDARRMNEMISTLVEETSGGRTCSVAPPPTPSVSPSPQRGNSCVAATAMQAATTDFSSLLR